MKSVSCREVVPFSEGLQESHYSITVKGFHCLMESHAVLEHKP